MSGHVLTKSHAPRYDELCADLIGVLRQMVDSFDSGRPPPTFVRCEGCGSTERDDLPCRMCAATRKASR